VVVVRSFSALWLPEAQSNGFALAAVFTTQATSSTHFKICTFG
jgi:hypothetical protein